VRGHAGRSTDIAAHSPTSPTRGKNTPERPLGRSGLRAGARAMLTIPGPQRVVGFAVKVPVVVVGIAVRPIAVGARAGYDAGIHRLEAIGDVVVPAVLGAVLD